MKNLKSIVSADKFNTKSLGKNILIPISIALSIIFGNVEAKSSKDIFETLNQTEVLSDFDKEKIAKEYIKNNLFVKGEPITNQNFNHSINVIGQDLYQIKYSHEFEGIPGFSEKSNKTISMNLKIIYKDNNIFIEFGEVSIGKHKLQDNGIVSVNNVIYDYDFSEGVNKSIEINSKANKQKTLEMIKEKIKKVGFISQSNIEKVEKHENTQITKLNDISLGNEVFGEGDSFYREIFFTEKGQYRPIGKVYFNKYGDLDLKKTNSELTNKDAIVLGSKINFNEIKESGDDIAFSISQENIEKLESNVSKHRELLINIIDRAKVGPNKEFIGFNKENKERIWSDKEERLFNTELIDLELIDDTYVFTWGDKTQKMLFGVEGEGENSKIFLKNKNNQKVNNFYVTIKNNYYKVSLQDNELSIYKIKKEELNVTNNLPSFFGDKNLVQLLENKDINTYYNLAHLEYFSNEGNLVANIPCSKTENGKYKLNKSSININTNDLYNHPNFKSITANIKKYQKKLNILDIDISNSFKILLEKEGIELNNQDLIKILDQNNIVHYCKISENKKEFNVTLDEKLYNKTKKSLETLKSRLEIVEKLNNTNVRWINNGKKEDFTKFVGGGWGIGTRFISQNNIINFVSKTTNEIKLDILRGEGEVTSIIYELSPKSFKIKRQGKSKVTISGQTYIIKIDEKGDIYLDPVEKNLK